MLKYTYKIINYIQKYTEKKQQILRVKSICSKTIDSEYHLQVLKERLISQGYHKNSMDQQFSKVKTIDRQYFLKEKTHNKETVSKILLVLTYNCLLPDIMKLTAKRSTLFT